MARRYKQSKRTIRYGANQMIRQPMCPNEALKHLCNGCQKRRFRLIRCAFHDHNQIEMCPCTICLVKMMCNDVCEDRAL